MASANLKELVEAMPSPAKKPEKQTPEQERKRGKDKEGILSDADKEAMDKALAEIHAGGKENVVALVGMLVPEDPPADSKVRHALHALATKVSGTKGDARKAFAAALASTLDSEKPREVQQFVIRQLQLCGGLEAAPALGKLLTDEALSTDATNALLAIREGAAEQFRAALPKSSGAARLNVVQALGTLRDAESAPALRELAQSSEQDIQRAALWALASAGDAGSADLLLKAADTSRGYDRTHATKACLLLAENLAETGRKADAARIYKHLRDTRNDGSEQHVRDAAEIGLKAAG